MATFKFRWPYPAEKVIVTGSFDNWSESEELVKVGDGFEKTIELSTASQKIHYKFIVDGDWKLDPEAPKELDHKGNENNFLTPDQMAKGDDAAAALINTVTPESTTAALAKDVPLEEPKATPSDIPGGFPITPAAELDKPIGIDPKPAADGAVNPIKLEPGQKVPESIAGATNDHVRLGKEDYERSDALPGVGSLPPVTKNMIPESSLPITGPNDAVINTVTPQSTTVGLAGAVPLEPKVPKAVKHSQEEAGVTPGASGDPEEVKEKAAVEAELKEKIPEAPVTSGDASVAAATLGGSVMAAAVSAKDAVVQKATPLVNQATTAATEAAAKLPEGVKQALPVSVQEAIGTQTKEEKREEVSPEVPAEVKESIKESGKSPEAAANTEAVVEKKAVEEELKKEVKPVPAEGETSTAAEANGSGTKDVETPAEAKNGSAPGSSRPQDSPATKDRKKRHRVSAIFSKIMHKITDSGAHAS